MDARKGRVTREGTIHRPRRVAHQLLGEMGSRKQRAIPGVRTCERGRGRDQRGRTSASGGTGRRTRAP